MMHRITVKELIVTFFLGITVMLLLMQKSLELNPNSSTALLRKGICEYHEKNYAAALETFTEGQKLNSADADLTAWIKGVKKLRMDHSPRCLHPRGLISQKSSMTGIKQNLK